MNAERYNNDHSRHITLKDFHMHQIMLNLVTNTMLTLGSRKIEQRERTNQTKQH
jgi:hypothetical protein